MLSLLGVHYHFRLTSVHYVKSTKQILAGVQPPTAFLVMPRFWRPLLLLHYIPKGNPLGPKLSWAISSSYRYELVAGIPWFDFSVGTYISRTCKCDFWPSAVIDNWISQLRPLATTFLSEFEPWFGKARGALLAPLRRWPDPAPTFQRPTLTPTSCTFHTAVISQTSDILHLQIRIFE